MKRQKQVKLIHSYLKLMPTYPLVTEESIKQVTLKDLRPRSLSQIDVAKALGKKDHSTISKWETGVSLANIKALDVLKLAILYRRNLSELYAAIENTQSATESEQEDNSQNAPPLEVVQR